MGGVQLGGGGGLVFGEMRFQSMGEMEKDFCLNLLQPLLENVDGSRELIPIFHNLHRKDRPSPLALARTMVYLEPVLSKAASRWRDKKQVRIDIQKAREYQKSVHPLPIAKYLSLLLN